MKNLIKTKHGANRIRTGDLFNAIEARYQLRYSPLVASSKL